MEQPETKPPLTFEEVMTMRQRVLAGDTPSMEDMARAIEFLRVSRAAAPAAKAAKAARTDGKPKMDLLSALKLLG